MIFIANPQRIIFQNRTECAIVTRAIQSLAFRIKYDRLLALTQSDDLDDILEASAVLRHFLFDGGGLAQSFANTLGLSVSYPTKPMIRMADGSMRGRNFVNQAEFLKTKIGSTSIQDAIDAVANAGGGVHHKAKTKELEMLSNALVIDDPAKGHALMLQIARYVCTGLAPLRNAVDRLSLGLEQRKISRQPQFSQSYRDIIFDGTTYIEACATVSFDTGFAIYTSFDLDPIFSQTACLFEIGERDAGSSVSLWRVKKNQLEVRVRSLGQASGRLNIDLGDRFKYSIIISLDPSGRKTLCTHTSHGMRSRVEGIRCSGDVSGKLTLGAALDGRSGARFAGGEMILFSEPCKPEHEQLILTDSLSRLPTWHVPDPKPKGTIVRISNQMNSLDQIGRMVGREEH